MIPIYLCDDEPQLVEKLKKIIQNQVAIFAFDMGPVCVSSNPHKLLETVRRQNERAIYFLDIDFPGYENGLELAVRLREHDPRGFIIFITAHDDLAMETFRYRLEAMDYIVKGDDNRLKSRIQACLKSIDQRLCDESNEDGGFYTLKILDEVRHIPVNKILYFEAAGRNHQIFLHMEDEIISFYGSLQQLEEELGGKFWRCHRGYLVNLYRVSRIFVKTNEIELDNQERCLLSRRARLNIPEVLSTKV